ncbi:MAG: class I SAM-dependent methyltransferase [Chitinophagaceae bacterium]|nr:class I SAM-dependent methyltransferase [Chitinophagaceae bacterium]
MSSTIHYTNCPVCGSCDISTVLLATDHTVSKEKFPVVECSNCTLRFTQNVPGPECIAPYYKSEDYISHTNTSKGLINRLYQFVRNRTMVSKRKLIQQSTGLSEGTLLDVGSGVGKFVQVMKQAGWQVTGLEPDADARKVAAQVYNTTLTDIAQFNDLPVGSFDAITMWHVLEHVHELQRYMQQLKALLKENGKLFIAVPNYRSTDAAIYKEHWAAYDVPRHLYHFSPRSIELLMEKNGMKVKAYKPMWYDSFYISLLSSKYKNGKPNLIAAFFNGLRSNFKTLGDVKRCSSVIYVISK